MCIRDRQKGKLYADTMEGLLAVKAEAATLTALDMVGNVLAEITGEKNGSGIVFTLDGTLPAVHYVLKIQKR